MTNEKKCDRIGELVVEQIENRESRKKEVKRNVLFCFIYECMLLAYMGKVTE